jgi:hypothetical protein
MGVRVTKPKSEMAFRIPSLRPDASKFCIIKNVCCPKRISEIGQ